EQYTRATVNGNMNDVRVHYYVDNTCAWQNLPLNLSGWHAADGSGNGNRRTIAIECIMSSAYNDRDKKSEDNAAKLAAALLKKYNLSIAKSNGMDKTALDRIKKFVYSDAELDAVLEKFIHALDGGTIVDYVAVNLKKAAYKCGIVLDDYEVHDEIGADTLVGKVMGLNQSSGF
ncbi:MAG: N-acetylmuramoyl-L-alanine amidase, partial [Ruminococcus sp.]|nr:N-acetylmuramoyl-L-alanine amidase [Ruminococcus sp.]